MDDVRQMKRSSNIWAWGASQLLCPRVSLGEMEHLCHCLAIKISTVCGEETTRPLIQRSPSTLGKHGGGSIIMLYWRCEGTGPLQKRNATTRKGKTTLKFWSQAIENEILHHPACKLLYTEAAITNPDLNHSETLQTGVKKSLSEPGGLHHFSQEESQSILGKSRTRSRYLIYHNIWNALSWVECPQV